MHVLFLISIHKVPFNFGLAHLAMISDADQKMSVYMRRRFCLWDRSVLVLWLKEQPTGRQRAFDQKEIDKIGQGRCN